MNYQSIQLPIPNKKGLKLATEIYKPESPGQLPAVLIFHGFTGYKEGVDLVDIADKLARNGIVAVRFTASGFGNSEGTLEGDYRLSNHRKDAECVYEYVGKLPYIDTARLGVYGHSMGGKLAVLFCYDHASVKALCIVSAPVTFFGTSYGAIEDKWRERGYFQKVSGRDGSTIRVPYEYLVDADSPRHDVLEAARHVANPYALVIAGESDTEVPWQETKKLYESLHCPKEFLLMGELDHPYKRNPKLIPLVHKPVIRFFTKYL